MASLRNAVKRKEHKERAQPCVLRAGRNPVPGRTRLQPASSSRS